MTRGQIIAELDAMIGPGNPLDGTAKAAFVNGAYMHMIDCISAVNPDYFTKSATAPTLNGQGQYDLPTDFRKALMVNVRQNGIWVRSKPLPNITDIPVITRTDTSQGFDSSEPGHYILGSQIGFMPILTDSTGLLKLWYVFDPPELEADGDEPAIPSTYHHTIKYGAYADFLDQDDEHAAAESMRSNFQRRIDKMIETMFENQVEDPKEIKIVSDDW